MLTAMVEAERVLWLAVCDIEINVPESSGISTLEDKSSTGGSVLYTIKMRLAVSAG